MQTPDDFFKLVYTIKELCRVCYTCVRECPAKAIRIEGGQAEVMAERCIGCGNCIKVCSQDAKVYRHTRTEVKALLKSEATVAAIVAPSFAAEFSDFSSDDEFVGALRALGFDYVFEVGFGADLVARAYRRHIKENPGSSIITSDCPAIVSYIRYYHPDLVSTLAPIVSPMVAMARVVRAKLNNEVKLVFIGPCIAKKAESVEVDQALTFRELRNMIEQVGVDELKGNSTPFDTPRAGKGAVFAISRGLIQTMNLKENLIDENIVIAEGRVAFQEAVKEFEDGKLLEQSLQLLCCKGCISGPGMTSRGKRYQKETFIKSYVRKKLSPANEEEWKEQFSLYQDIDLTQQFEPNDQRLPLPSQLEVDKVLASMGKFAPRDHLNCGACGYETCLEHAIAIVEGLAEIEMCLPYTIEELHESVNNLAVSNEKLAKVQQALNHSEKLAHMGQLSAGIAHELNNPLGVVLMYSNILLDECSKEDPLRNDLELIAVQADRCKKIVSGLLNFARRNQLKLEQLDLKKLANDSLSSVIIPEGVRAKVICKAYDCSSLLDYDQMMQVLTNLNRNAIEAMPNGGELTLEVGETGSDISISIKDSGCGIPEAKMDKLFTPFFTTKGIGKGTGLGLATSYGIVKMHKGRIDVESNSNPSKGPTGTTFKIVIPKDISQVNIE